jgi:hypothetical protein
MAAGRSLDSIVVDYSGINTGNQLSQYTGTGYDVDSIWIRIRPRVWALHVLI